MVPHDLDNLIDTIGGKDFAEKRLDILFERLDARYEDEWFASGNEPDFHVPWIYNWTNSPEKTSITINRIHREMYNTTSSGLPGNDDLGTMGAWYVLSSIGLYPLIPGTAGFSLNLPQFKKIKIDLPTNTLIIKNEDEEIKTIKSVHLNDKKINRLWLELNKIDSGGVIQFNKLN